MKRWIVTAAAWAVLGLPLVAQSEGPADTQVLVRTATKGAASGTTLSADALSVEVNDKRVQVTSVARVAPSDMQVALLIDDGLRSSVGRQLSDLQQFIKGLPQGTEIFVGYMQNGRVIPEQKFTTNLAQAASELRIPLGTPGISASPYFCVSDFVKHWPVEEAGSYGSQTPVGRKARFILMLTNGVDPYNGSVSPLNQNSPYVQTTITDAQRAGIPVSSIYYGDAGIRGGAANFSGQSYLSQVAEGTGGVSLYQGTFNPVSLQPFLKQFDEVLGSTYIASFPVPEHKDLVGLQVRTSVKSMKVYAARSVHPGMMFLAAANGTAGTQ